jgi:hypothetical protein
MSNIPGVKQPDSGQFQNLKSIEPMNTRDFIARKCYENKGAAASIYSHSFPLITGQPSFFSGDGHRSSFAVNHQQLDQRKAGHTAISVSFHSEPSDDQGGI